MSVQVSPDLPRTDDLVPVRPWLLRLLRPLFVLAFRYWWRVRVDGLEHLPPGPAILAANHLAVLDGPLVVAMVRRDAYAMIKNEMFAGWLGRALLLVGQVPIDRRNPDPEGVRRCVRVLRDGRLLVIFPEGVRGSGDFTTARGGAAYLALVTGAPIVPVALAGTRASGGGVGALPRRGTRLSVRLGEPIEVPAQPWPRRSDEVARWTETVRERLAAHVADSAVERRLDA